MLERRTGPRIDFEQHITIVANEKIGAVQTAKRHMLGEPDDRID